MSRAAQDRLAGMLTALKAALSYFGVVFALGFVLGTIRTLVILPLTGELAAVALELPLMIAASWIVCGWALRRFKVSTDTGSRTAMSLAALILLMGAELLVSLLVAGRSPAEHLMLYRTAPVLLGLCGQLAYAAFPLIRLR
ncbi:MAG: hypothetical protein KUA43_12895 [Hoeflea sp.]|uniref:hypothetical protein n=1 Tax=Hoeflea sp. TaxID=1940281 RepID=UPI001D1EB68A|nr:hypothetical protein [Hoeflea sp.]MBU4527911.1 hypothetical protein [Alphaproteobacteria bacterium]MBU4546054.1 hypothetical protein [Alphaproteobacteria bacterium]MBU4553261.1 hypothetical protein [Alphaproteobacteria bacterium]MBV1724333.1 hypothetical protein [Hoeflea sp.]MBV1763329.1 hypothetical protein [Hoeflea sp.]